MTIRERKRLLIVDNNDRDCAAVAELVRSVGYEVLSTWSGREALKLLAVDQFDLVLVDSFVADMYVCEFLELVSRLTARPTIALTSGGQSRAAKRDLTLRKYPVFDKRKPVELVQALGMAYLEEVPVNASCAYVG